MILPIKNRAPCTGTLGHAGPPPAVICGAGAFSARFAGGIAHDFNNILFPIIVLSEMRMDDFPAGIPEYENAQQIVQAGARGRDLIDQILAFSRQSEHEPSPVRLQRVIEEVMKLCRPTIPADIEITQSIQKDCGLARAAIVRRILDDHR